VQNWRNRQQRAWRRHLARLLALLLFLSPLLAPAYGSFSPTGLSETPGNMPCHQAERQKTRHPCTHCEPGKMALDCDCCDMLMPLSLVLNPGSPTSVPQRSHLRLLSARPELPEPPPGFLYRPPIRLQS
jgi:hypothetical protein